MRNEDLFPNAPGVQPLGRYQVVQGTDTDTQHPGSGFAVIQEPGFHRANLVLS